MGRCCSSSVCLILFLFPSGIRNILAKQQHSISLYWYECCNQGHKNRETLNYVDSFRSLHNLIDPFGFVRIAFNLNFLTEKENVPKLKKGAFLCLSTAYHKFFPSFEGLKQLQA
jgi:hypothetical protein